MKIISACFARSGVRRELALGVLERGREPVVPAAFLRQLHPAVDERKRALDVLGDERREADFRRRVAARLGLARREEEVVRLPLEVADPRHPG